MKITGTYVESAGAGIMQTSGTNEKSNINTPSFESILAESGKKDNQTRPESVKSEQRPRADRPKRKNPEMSGKTENLRNPQSDTVKTDAKPKTDISAENQEITPDEETVAELAEDLVEDIADALSVSAEQIQAIIASMGIRLEDLAKPEILAEFMLKVKGAEHPVELLSKPEIMTEIKSIKELVADFRNELSEAVVKREQPVKPDEVDNGITEAVQVAVNQQFPIANDEETADVLPVQQAVQAAPEHTEEAKSQERQFGAETDGNHDNTQDFVINQAAVNPLSNETSFTAQAVNREAVSNVDTQDVIRQISEKINVSVKADTTEIKMTLKPESLGEVRLKIITENGIITAQFQAENQRVKEIIEAGFNRLRDTLTEQGLSVANLSVSVGQEQSSQMEQFQQERSRSAGRISRILGAAALEPEEAEDTSANLALNETQVDYIV